MVFTTSTPITSRTAIPDSDSEDEELNAMLHYQPLDHSAVKAKPKTTPTPVPKQSATKPRKEPESPEKIAERHAKYLYMPSGVKSPSQLYWHKTSEKKVNKVFPCRECEPYEAFGLIGLPQEWDQTQMVLVQFLGHVSRDAGNYKVVTRESLVPYQGESNDNDDDKWCPEIMQQYEKQLLYKKQKGKEMSRVEILLELKMLERILQHAKRKAQDEEAARQEEERLLNEEEDDHRPLKRDEKPAEPQPEARVEQDDDDGSIDVDIDFPERTKIPLCAGNVIEYTNPILRAGDERGKRVATILSVNPRRKSS